MKAVLILVVVAVQMEMAYRSRASPLKDEHEKIEGIIEKMLERDEQTIEGSEKKTLEERQTSGLSSDSTYIGCFTDDASRHFKRLQRFGSGTTLAACRQYCMGYRYVGLEASDWCTCGNTLYQAGYPLVDDAECNRPCQGETTRMCGGSWRHSIYFV